MDRKSRRDRRGAVHGRLHHLRPALENRHRAFEGFAVRRQPFAGRQLRLEAQGVSGPAFRRGQANRVHRAGRGENPPRDLSTDKEGYKNISYQSISPVLVEAVKQLKVDNDNQATEIKAIRAANDNEAAEIKEGAPRQNRIREALRRPQEHQRPRPV